MYDTTGLLLADWYPEDDSDDDGEYDYYEDFGCPWCSDGQCDATLFDDWEEEDDDDED